MKFLSNIVVIAAMLVAMSSHAHEFELEFLTGSDSNPNRLSDELIIDQTTQEVIELDPGIFGTTSIKFSHTPRNTGFYYDLDARNTSYYADDDADSSPQHADEVRGSLDLGFRWRPRLPYGRARFIWGLYGGSRDSTYVRKSTGRIARTPEAPGGISLEDRFDKTWVGFESSGRIGLPNDADFVFDWYVEDNQYEEILGANISNLNYTQAELDIGFEKWVWPSVQLITMVGVGARNYEDRRAKDEDGDDLPGTDLSFVLSEVDFSLEYLITDRWKFQIGLDLDSRIDNELGYYDTTQRQLYTRFRYRNGDFVRFLIYLSYVTRKFDNIEESVVAGIDEEDLREREGYRGRIELQRALMTRDIWRFDLILGVEAASFDNSNPNFTYSRNQAYLGFRWQPY